MIGVFDSGVGGLSVVKELTRELPDLPLIYFGDTARVPYGNKSKETVCRYAEEDADFLLKHEVSTIVIACNTASALALDTLKRHVTVPLFNVVEPAVARSLAVTKSGRIGVIGTRATIGSGIFKRLLTASRKDIEVFTQATPLLVPLIEEHWVKRPETKKILRHYLRPLKLAQIDTLILACTHYPLLEKEISEVMGKKVTIVNPSREVVLVLRDWLEAHPEEKARFAQKAESRFYVSDDPARFREMARWWLGKPIEVELAPL